MKLLAKYNRVNIPITIATLLITGIGFYFIIHYVLLHQIDKDLRIEQQEIIHYIQEKKSLPEGSNYKDQQIEFQPANASFFKTKFSTEDIYNSKENEVESFRKLQFLIRVNDHNYIAIVKKSQQETEDIIQLILIITFSVIIFLLLVLFIVNRFLLAKIWQPFNHILEQLKQFNLSSKNKIVIQKTDIKEFRELNEAAVLMSGKVSKDYESLKSFTENASHEIQTPLAIIKNKIELLLQSENLDETQFHAIQSVNDAASKLSRLNESLLLLTKIENRQFEDVEKIDFSHVVNQCIENFEELASIKNISIEKNIAEDIFIEINDSLAEILSSNILLNAIKHNIQNGKIIIDLSESSMSVSNTGDKVNENTELFFERFKKNSSSGDSIGLGLAIVKTICDTYGFRISYTYKQGIHFVKVNFY
ncbi:MAG: sensor histidine kinase [Ginsengibacter sp.]